MSWLLFTLNLNPNPSSLDDLPDSYNALVTGKLSIMDDVHATKSFAATSGFPVYQYLDAQSLMGRGPIPACRKIGINAYTVGTLPFDLVNLNRDNEENFYFIEPTNVDVDGVNRGNFQIEFDGDVPGSSGSIGLLNKQDWQDFQQFMTDYREQGFESIDLIVEYNETSAQPLSSTLDNLVFTVDSPQPGEVKKISDALTFSGTAESSVATIIATVGRDELFLIGKVNPTGETWNLSVRLDNPDDKHFKFRALDKVGNLLQTIEFGLILDVDP